MEQMIGEADKILEKISLIESFISLHLRRDRIQPQIQELAEKTESVKSLIQQCNELMKVEYSNAMDEYKAVMAKIQYQQMQILNILIEKKKNEKTENTENEYRGCRTPQGILLERQQKSGQKATLAVPATHSTMKGQGGVSRMYLDEYQQSPFVRKVKPAPVPFQFLDFEVKITPEMFDTVPKYMKGRETLDELTHFLDTILVPCFNEKYQLLHRRRDCIRNHVDLDLWKVYNDQAAYFPGQNFITQGDISRKIKKMLDKKSQNKITMLRHLGILQEQRKAQTVCYIWTASNI